MAGSAASLRLLSLRDGAWGPAAAAWEAVYGAMPGAGPFLAPAWVGAWVAVYGPTCAPVLAVVQDAAGAPVGACLLVRQVRRSAVVPHVRLHVNTDGEPEADSVVVEHNGFLAVPGAEALVYETLAAHVAGGRGDALHAAGFDAVAVERLTAALPGWRVDVEWRTSPYVDLVRLQAEGGDHLRVVSRNTREQLRRSLDRYRHRGPLGVEPARTAEEAEAMLEELVALHERRWHAVGEPGAFASPLRRRFHRAVVRAGVPDSTAQLLRIRAGEDVLAVLYTIVANGRVNFYQSGLRYEEDKHLKPGLVAHHLAIQHCLAAGFTEYDFLVSGPGEGRYKASLANAERRLGWVTLHRPGWRDRYFSLARSARRALTRPAEGRRAAPAATTGTGGRDAPTTGT